MNAEEVSAVIVDATSHAHKQRLTRLPLLGLSRGLLINFGAPTFKDGCRRIVNHHPSFASSRLRVNQPPAEIP
ncbi:hypothetical protein NXS98_17720 [Fontisphaera persica]|uniref:hypothetical protein n=1 Tax=Fontisphaera persica TaxID=2974023 RepID=UPI0024C0C333|nr:hypothetical protein [Fontisphaera persica]WCJ59530.1 hypothetical protein NXS98_17720 [Fontisphaera persica]